MKLCYIISDINKSVNLELTLTGLRNRGIEPIIILINSTNKALHQHLLDHSFEVYTLEAGSLLKSLPQIQKVKFLLKSHDITHVHCHLAHANWIGLIAAKLAKVPRRIYTRHAGKPLRMNWKERIIDFIQNLISTQIVSISPAITQYLIEQKVSKSKLFFIPHGFNIKRFNEPNSAEIERIKNLAKCNENAPVIGVIARWMEWKGVHNIIEAFRLLLKDYPNAKLVLFGGEGGDYKDEIRRLCNSLPESTITSIPFEENVFDLYQIMDVYVHVPVNVNCEAFGQTYVEALAAGIPSVFTLSGIASEFAINEYNCLIVPYNDATVIFHAITRILNNEELRYKLIMNGKSSVNAFTFDSYLTLLEKLYNEP